MISALGIDIIEVNRIGQNMIRYGDRFIKRVLSPIEFDSYNSRTDKEQFLAGRFAAKEALLKAIFSISRKSVRFSKIDIINDETGCPKLLKSKDFEELFSEHKCLISISHEKNYAVAVVLLC